MTVPSARATGAPRPPDAAPAAAASDGAAWTPSRVVPPASRGLALIEIVVVIAVVAILAGVLGPLLTGAVGDAGAEAGNANMATIAQALSNFNTTTGQWPAMNASGQPDQLRILLSGGSLPAANPWTAAHPFWTWVSTGFGDVLGHHLIANSPRGQTSNVYPTAGRSAWRGPYLDASPLDRWGRPFVVNVIAGHSTHPIEQRRLWVLSAGPDGAFQTQAAARVTDGVGGDDIGFLVRQR